MLYHTGRYKDRGSRGKLDDEVQLTKKNMASFRGVEVARTLDDTQTPGIVSRINVGNGRSGRTEVARQGWVETSPKDSA